MSRVLQVEVDPDGRGRLDGALVPSEPATGPAGARAAALRAAAAIAADVGQPMAIRAVDPDGTWDLTVHPDGRVEDRTGEPAQADAPDPEWLADAVRRVAAALDAERPFVAAQLADQLHQELASAYGAEHPDTVRVLEVWAHALTVAKEYVRACEAHSGAASVWAAQGESAEALAAPSWGPLRRCAAATA